MPHACTFKVDANTTRYNWCKTVTAHCDVVGMTSGRLKEQRVGGNWPGDMALRQRNQNKMFKPARITTTPLRMWASPAAVGGTKVFN